MKTGITVGEAMTERPILLSSTDSIVRCAEEMLKNKVGAVIISDGDNPVGIITEQDIVHKSVAQRKNPVSMKISDVMCRDITTIAPGKDIFEALMLMRDLNIRHLPVTDGEKMVGLLTLKDILKIEPQLFDLLAEKFELREEARKPINKTIDGEGICQLCGKYAQTLSESGSIMLCGACNKEE